MSHINLMVNSMPKYRCTFAFTILFHLLLFMGLQAHDFSVYSVLRAIKYNEASTRKASLHYCSKTVINGKHYMSNVVFTNILILILITTIIATWTYSLLLCCGDIHPHPGPLSSTSTISIDSSLSNSSCSMTNNLNLSHHLSFVHYNVQSISSKLDIIYSELLDFDILAFSETWLNPDIPTDDLLLDSFNKPERKDRPADSHGGVMVYVKEGLHYKRRHDLEPNRTECIWIEIINKTKHVLFGVFYRPPNSDSTYFSSIEDSFHLATDTSINDIIITGDFNFNVLHAQHSRKIEALCRQFSLYQMITEPTHFTENSSSLLDIILVNNKNHVTTSGVGDPFLDQNIRYHCPVFGVFKFTKPKVQCYKRHIWQYDRDDYDHMRALASTTNWHSLQDDDVDIYALNLTNKILHIAKECIPNRVVTIRPSDPPWITTTIKRYIRKRKRIFRKAKQTDSPHFWSKFRKIRNKVTSLIRDSKSSFHKSIADKLMSGSISSRDWWPTLKSFISPKSSSTIPPLEKNGTIYVDEFEKAQLLNDFFTQQTHLDESNANLPNLVPFNGTSELDSIILNSIEVESVLKSLASGKASGPNGLNNRILKELSKELAQPLCNFFNFSLDEGVLPSSYEEANVCPIHKKDERSLVNNYRPISLLNAEVKVFERLIFKHLFNHLQENSFLTSLQSGFMPGDSTVNQLTFLYNIFCQALDANKETRVVFCDISKAFDRVWHAGLLRKLEAAGVTGKLLNWFKNYLFDRKQRVILPGVNSD